MENVLKKKLKYCNKVRTSDVSLHSKIYKLVIDGIAVVLKFEEGQEGFYRFRKYDINREDDWCTYDDCRSLKFYIEEEKFLVDIELYGKERIIYTDDYRYSLRWKATIELPLYFIKEAENIIEHKFEKFCQESYEEYLYEKRIEWIKDFKEKILS